MTKKIMWILLIVFAIIIGLYPSIYFFIDRKFGLLSSKPAELLTNTFWNIGFYTHILLGGMALLIGWTQFSSKIRLKNLRLHKQIGKLYLISVMLSSIAGIYIGFFATGGLPSSLGFISLGIVWFYTTLNAYLQIKNKRIAQHQKMMVYSYAACFAAVTLRIWLPLLTIIYGDFLKAYITVAWLCWIPNLFIAHQINKQLARQKV
ncbi:DUF2306 domain-containing protein [Flavobacterium sp. Fl-77]|uniref:DUF2306 domain-containing protein n=1 Tax=Flavobacterium flavipigmentatum TaxID=2893884 RepID=A0AAJ2SBG2_9FLAO|nr:MULTISPECIES: DUF2306 domain-containing protein [unclassified Flavobacterium]MDX6181131.1 DUF2306 domain-containing protein [Flavobacterium sp. Fl-33]MDX6184732.1 DUF2306 domain-containing protein [Flavobacterium sp. Fl-77]UFH39831.1 DUF2306 domain-containing protein [Flavobacterium sp. F-70]